MELKKIGFISVAHLDLNSCNSTGYCKHDIQKEYHVYLDNENKKWYYRVGDKIVKAPMFDVVLWLIAKDLAAIGFQVRVNVWNMYIDGNELIRDTIGCYLEKFCR